MKQRCNNDFTNVPMPASAHGSAVGSNNRSTLTCQIQSQAKPRVMQSPGRAEG